MNPVKFSFAKVHLCSMAFALSFGEIPSKLKERRRTSEKSRRSLGEGGLKHETKWSF